MDGLTIAGPTLAALLHSLLSNSSPCDGLLLGEHFSIGYTALMLINTDVAAARELSVCTADVAVCACRQRVYHPNHASTRYSRCAK
jgi:hypothetical protein